MNDSQAGEPGGAGEPGRGTKGGAGGPGGAGGEGRREGGPGGPGGAGGAIERAPLPVVVEDAPPIIRYSRTTAYVLVLIALELLILIFKLG